MIACPVFSCKKSFLNKYSLTNHLCRFPDDGHQDYYKKNVAIKNCPLCDTPLRNNRKYKNEEGLCYTCYKAKYFKPKKINKEWLIKKCFKCKKEVSGYFSPRNTRVLCDICTDLKKKHKKIYNKEFDRRRYRKNKRVRHQRRLLEREKQLKDLLLLLKEEILKETPIHKICKKYHISLLSIRKIVPLIMTDEEYHARNNRVRSKAVQLRIDDLKNYLKNNPNARNLNRRPNLLEKNLGEKIKTKFPFIKLRYNVWKSLRDRTNDCYAHLESDIILNFNETRIIILIDGEAFHGKNSYFNGDTVEEDERKSQILSEYNPFVIRYSETEVKKDYALKHLSNTIESILSNKTARYYRNWMMDKKHL